MKPPTTTPVTYLRCVHGGWLGYALLAMPNVAILCVLALIEPSMQFIAGCSLGLWLGMWMVVFWAWLTRKKAAESEPAPESL